MAENNQNDQRLVLAQQLEQQGLDLGQTAFDALNEHDKLLKVIRDAISGMQETFSTIGMTNMEMTCVIEDMGVSADEKNMLHGLNDRNSVQMEYLLQNLSEILTAAEYGSETIHKMEECVANEQETV